MNDTLVEKCREARTLEAKLSSIANAHDRGGDTSGEPELRAQLLVAQSAALEEAQRRIRDEGRGWLEDIEKRLMLLSSRPGSERLAANAALARLHSFFTGAADATFAAPYADAVDLLIQHRRFLDAVLKRLVQ